MQVRELISASDFEKRASLLKSRALSIPTCNRAWGAFDGNTLLGTVGALGETLVGFAVAEDREGQGLSLKLTERAVSDLFLLGFKEIRAFTKASEAERFKGVGFHLVACTSQAAFMEWNASFSEHLKRLEKMALETPEGSSAVVLNANPFTLGHRALVESALRESPFVWVFVVSEDISEFLFEDRLKMVQNALSDLPNVRVVPSGPYMVSLATFPSYFTKEAERVRVHAELDLTLFISQAKALKITSRYVGEEPFSLVTAQYNSVMKELLPKSGIACREIARQSLANTGSVISASVVRELLRSGRFTEALCYLPTVNSSLISEAFSRSRLFKEQS